MRAHLIIALMLSCTGAACNSSDCGEGFRQEGAECVAIVTEVTCELPCAVHERCDTTLEPPGCVCVDGYEGSPCSWAGAPLDPGFEASDLWMTTNGASVIPSAEGFDGSLGIAYLGPAAACSAGKVSQVLEMPSYEDIGPLVAEVTYRSPVAGVDIGFDRAHHPLLATAGEEWQTERFCVGEAVYDGPVEFQVTVFERVTACFDEPTDEIEVDRLELKAANANECPTPGTALNGDANIEEGGWFFVPGRGAAEAGLQQGVGQNGTDGARLFEESDLGSEAAMGTLVSVPLPGSLPSPALRFWWRGTADAAFTTYLGTSGLLRFIDILLGDETEKVYTYCLPPWTHGSVIDLVFQRRKSTTDAELVVDSVEVLSDERCGDSTDLLDPSFDSAPNRWPGVRVSGDGDAVTVVENAAEARTGNGALEISYTTNLQSPRFETWVLVPQSVDARGPQVRFYSNVPAVPKTPIKWLLGRAAEIRGDLATGGGWLPNEICLPPEWADRWFRFQVGVGPKGPIDPLVTFDPPSRVLLDDFEVTTSAACPAR